MAAQQAKALFEFESGAPGELSFAVNEVLTILRQDVGDGWWEAKNNRGQKGLVPESYFEITSFREPSIPPPPPPTSYPENAASSSSMQTGAAVTGKPAAPGGRPQRPPAANKSGAAAQQQTVQMRANASVQQQQPLDDDWDSWDDDDDNSSTTTETQDMSGMADGAAGSDNKQTRRREAPRASRNPFNRFSQFAKAGGEAYLFESLHVNVSDNEKKFTIVDGPDGPMWMTNEPSFECSVASPKKETKFHGIKSYIAYQLTPTFSNIQVSRRYKHFDWLHERLVEKFCTLAIPPLPEKQISGRFEEDFVNQRLRQLQNWVDRMCKHAVIAHSDVFEHFLTCTDDKRWKQGKRKAEKDEYLGGKFFLTIRTPNRPIDSRTADQQLEKFTRFVRSMDDSVKQLSVVCESNVKKHQGPFKKEFQKLGESFMALAKSFEFDDRPGAAGLTRAIESTGTTYSDIGDLYAAQPRNDMYYLLDGLQEYKGLLSTFPDTLMMHKAAAAKVQEAATKGSEAGKMTESDVQSLQNRADVITYTVLAEMQHFQQYRVGDFKKYMTSYLQGQIDFYKAVTAKLEDSLRQY